MKIVDVKPGPTLPGLSPADATAMVTVQRGLWGTTPAAHPANATVLAPIYHAKGSYPGGSAGHIRYAWNPLAVYTADYVAGAYTSPQTLDGLWMDCFGSQPFRALDATGRTVGQYMYNIAAGERFGRAGYVAAQAVLVRRVRAAIQKNGGQKLYANNVDNWNDAPALLVPGTLLDGGAKEAFIGSGDGPCGFTGEWHNWGTDKWVDNMANLANVSAAGLAVMPMVGSAGCESPQLAAQPTELRAAVEEFAYATFLIVAGTRNQLLGVVPYRLRSPTRGVAGGLEMWLHRRYFWPVGEPRLNATSLVGYGARGAACNATYARPFSEALALVNAATGCTEPSLRLPGGPWYDPEATEPAKAVETVRLGPQRGKLLLSAPPGLQR